MHLDYSSYIPYLIIILTAITSIKGFGDMAFFDRLKFNVGAILGNSKQWDRLITSAFLHGDWMHLIFNMMTLYFFSDVIIDTLGIWQYLVIYFLSIIGGGLLSLFVHRHEYYYSAIGASGGVVGILFAAIAIYPQMGLSMFFIPIAIPAWIFGLGYLAFSLYGMHSNAGNIGHDAHMGGAVVGLLCAIIFLPQILFVNTYYIAILVLPIILLAIYIWKKR